MEIKKTITLKIDKRSNSLICYDAITLNMIMGASSVSGNLNMYSVKKEDGKYIIPIKSIKDRINILERRLLDLEDKLFIMKQVLK